MSTHAEQPPPTSPQDLFEILQRLDIQYELHTHPPFFTVEEGVEFEKDIPGLHCRNLFLRDKKKKNFLITAANETQIDLKALPSQLGCGRLSFGSPERLWQSLGIRPGAVSPFCAINDSAYNVTLIIDKTMTEAQRINVHPLDNTMTIGFHPDDLLRFYAHTGHEPLIVDFNKI
jgi:Ala-tRNA(Pro) deacylase